MRGHSERQDREPRQLDLDSGSLSRVVFHTSTHLIIMNLVTNDVESITLWDILEGNSLEGFRDKSRHLLTCGGELPQLAHRYCTQRRSSISRCHSREFVFQNVPPSSACDNKVSWYSCEMFPNTGPSDNNVRNAKSISRLDAPVA
jgi:hypothetical protein